MAQQQQNRQGNRSGGGRNRNRGGGGGTITILGVPIPRDVVAGGLRNADEAELGDFLLWDYLPHELARQKQEDADKTDDDRQRREQRELEAHDKSADATVSRVERRQKLALDRGKTNAEINRIRTETETRATEAAQQLEHNQALHELTLTERQAKLDEHELNMEERRAASAREAEDRVANSRKSNREAAAKVAVAFSLFGKRMVIRALSGLYRANLARFMNSLNTEAREHFNKVLSMREHEEEMVSILMALAGEETDEARFAKALSMNLLPPDFTPEEVL